MSKGSEVERADYYDAHRAEVEAWPEVAPPAEAKVPTQRSVVVSVRFTTEEVAEIERAAHARGLTVSSYVRAIAREAVGTESPIDTSRIADRLRAIADELRPTASRRRRARDSSGAEAGSEGHVGRA